MGYVTRRALRAGTRNSRARKAAARRAIKARGGHVWTFGMIMWVIIGIVVVIGLVAAI